MIVVYCLLIPVLYFYILSAIPSESVHRDLFAYFVGLFLAVGGALLEWLFFSGISHDTLSPLLSFLLIFLFDSAVPFILLPFTAFFLVSARFQEQNKLVVSACFGIATVFLPYIMFLRYSFSDLWPSIMLPLLMMAFLFFTDMAWRKILERKPSALSELFPEVLIPLAMLLATDGLKTIWLYGYSAWFVWPVSIVIVLAGAALRLYKYFR